MSCEVTRTTTMEPRPCHARPLAKPQGSPDLARGGAPCKIRKEPRLCQVGCSTIREPRLCLVGSFVKPQNGKTLSDRVPCIRDPVWHGLPALCFCKGPHTARSGLPCGSTREPKLARSELPCGSTKDLTLQCLGSLVVLQRTPHGNAWTALWF